MSYIGQIRAWFAGESVMRSGPRVLVVGDSHTAALKRAKDFRDRADNYKHIEILRVQKDKGHATLGEVDLEAVCRTIRRFGANDFVFSAIGGNQYAVVGTVQSPIDFYVLGNSSDEDVVNDEAEIVPARALTSYIEGGVRGNDGPVLRELRASTKARIFHLLPPPPKRDNEFISRYFESRFADEGIEKLGPSRPTLRLKCWDIQSECLKRLCAELDIGLVRPPQDAVEPEGFLAPNCYARDATHGNRRYGEMVLKQILEISGTNPPDVAGDD